MIATKLFASTFLLSSCLCAWEDHPDRDNHRDTDRCFRDAQNSTNCGDSDRSTVDGGYENSKDRDDAGPAPDSHFGIPDRDN